MTALPRRIVHLASGREWRGGQNQVLLLTRALAARRDEVEQIVITGRGTLLAERLVQAGVPVRTVGWSIGLSPAALLGAIAEGGRRPTLFHAHDAHALTLAGLAAAVTRSPFVATRRVDFHLRRRGFWVRADRVIAISEAVRAILVSDGIPSSCITTVHSGIDVAGVRSISAGDIRSRLGLPVAGPLVVTVGALVDHKDHATLVEAATALRPRRPEVHWVIAGEGELRRDLEARIERLGMGDRIHLVGQIQEPLRLIASADVFVMSSKEEGLGTTVLDAMALGVPIAATSGGGIPEMLSGGAGLLSPPQDPRALADSVERLLTEPALRETTRRAASARVEGFSATAMANGVLSVYRSVTESVDLK
ncbi:MAG TPA: glycosyltransferase [Gemmatimonadales bacterium]|nr:glycosyltransferase [Gemmatimonadales bacterium]